MSWLPALATAALVALAPTPAPASQDLPAETATTAGVEWLAGRWEGQGRRGGEALPATLEARIVLGGQFLELVYASGGFEGRAFYRPAGAGRWIGQWYDSRGMVLPLQARVDGQSLIADWGDAATERGRTTYRLRDDGRLEISDSVAGANGDYRPFASHLLDRRE